MVQTGTVLWQDNSTYNMFSANTTQTGSAESVVADPYFATNTVTLLNFDNIANGTTTLATKDLTNTVWTMGKGTAQVSTSVKKYGTGSIYFPSTGSNSSISLSGSTTETAVSTAFNFGTGDFTIEFWAYPITSTGTRGIFALHTATGTQHLCVRLDNTNKPNYTFGGSTSNSTTSATALSANTWYHFAFVRASSTLTLYIDGTSKATTASMTYNVPSAPGVLGRSYSDNLSLEVFPGYVDELRVTKGIARYTANFTPPAGPFATS